MLAAASDAVVLGFNVRPVGDARAAGRARGRGDPHLLGHLPGASTTCATPCRACSRPRRSRTTVGNVEVRQIFRASRIGTIAGCYVTDGHVTRGAKVRLVRDGTVVYDGDDRLAARASTTTCARSPTGFECGIVLANYQDVKEGDVLEVYETRQVEREPCRN